MADRCDHCSVRMDGLEVHADDCPVRGPEIVAESEALKEENATLRAEVEKLKVLASHNSMPTCVEGCDSPALYCDCLKLQNQGLQNLCSTLIQYVHDMKRHQTSIHFCKEEPCPATLEFLSKTEKPVGQPQFVCNKCGYCGPVQYPHHRFRTPELVEFCAYSAAPVGEKRIEGSCVCRMDADEPSHKCPVHRGA